jgi:hypothetical protein
MRAGQIELVAHEIGKAGARLDRHLHRTPVDVEGDRVHAAAS